MRQHFILCGLGRVGWRVLDYLRAAGEPVVVIDTRCAADDPRLCGVPLICGDCRQPAILERAGLAEARGVLVVTSDDLVSLSTALAVRHLHPTVRVVVRLFNQSLITRLGTAVANVHALSTSALAAPLLALIARTGAALGVVRLANDERRQVVEFTVAELSPLVGHPLSALAERFGVAVVAHRPAGGALRLATDFDAAGALQAGDGVIVCGAPARLAPLLAEGKVESLPELLWAGLVRRLSRVILRTVTQIDRPVKICTVLLVVVIVLSVLVFRFGMAHDTFIDALYRTISLMATGADMHGDELEPGAWQKAFISGLRVLGMALTAAFTAIFTNYLIRANLGGALEVRRIPESGHVIVCGLGNVGFRAVADLLQQGEQVVVIERAPDNPFIAAARRLGAAVIVGNAAVAEVLTQARAHTARAVIAATSNELLNLEVALLARELAPRQRVVVRLTDPHLARTLREAAHVRLALSIPELSAPAFVASLYGTAVRGLFQVEERLLAAYDLQARTDDPWLIGPPLTALAATHRFVPICRHDAKGAEIPLSPTQPLSPGERLTVIIGLDDLQELLRRERTPATS